MRKFEIKFCQKFAAAVLLCTPFAAHAAEYTTIETSTIDWEQDPSDIVRETSNAAASQFTLASFGPFNVVSNGVAELVGSIETGSAAQFKHMLAAYPGINQINMIDCPGTNDDAANFQIARMIRKSGITTYIPDGGSVRSGGVELFLAGVRRVAEPTAEFAVHSWQDDDGLEADDVPANDTVNLEYINYYREIGMDEQKARAFYAMTNSVPHDSALYLNRRDIAAYLPLD